MAVELTPRGSQRRQRASEASDGPCERCGHSSESSGLRLDDAQGARPRAGRLLARCRSRWSTQSRPARGARARADFAEFSSPPLRHIAKASLTARKVLGQRAKSHGDRCRRALSAGLGAFSPASHARVARVTGLRPRVSSSSDSVVRKSAPAARELGRRRATRGRDGGSQAGTRPSAGSGSAGEADVQGQHVGAGAERRRQGSTLVRPARARPDRRQRPHAQLTAAGHDPRPASARLARVRVQGLGRSAGRAGAAQSGDPQHPRAATEAAADGRGDAGRRG